MDILVTGRHCQINDDFREKVTKRLLAVEKFKDRIIRIEVQVSLIAHSRPEQGTKVEITLVGKGPAIRAEGQADEKLSAFDIAFDRLKTQLRRAADRRKKHRGLRSSQDFVELTNILPPEPATEKKPETKNIAGIEVQGDGPLVVREKVFKSAPLSLAQALDEMELVGHDFFLYVDEETRQPSVVYRRKAYDYGVIHLDLKEE